MNKKLLYILFTVLHPLICLAQFDTTILNKDDAPIFDSIEKLPNHDKMIAYKVLCWERRLYNSKLALNYGSRSLKLAKMLNELEHETALYNYLGVINRNINNYPVALEYYFKAQQMAEENNFVIQKAFALNNIGDIHNRKQDYALASKYIKEALKLFTQQNDKGGIAYCNNQLGHVMRNMGKQSEALKLFYRTMELRKELADTIGIAVANNYIGEIYILQNKLAKSKQYFLKSLTMLDGSTDLESICLVYLNIGKYYIRVDSIKQAKKYLYQSLKLSRNFEFKERTSQASFFLSEVYSKETNYQTAFKYFKVFKELSDSILKDENAAKITQIEMQREYDGELKRREIVELRKDKKTSVIITILSLIAVVVLVIALGLFRINKIKQKTNIELVAKNEKIIRQQKELKDNSEELAEYNRTKDKLFSIIAHDLKNPYNAIIGFTNLLISDLEAGEYQSATRLAQNVLKASQKNYDLLVNLLEWANSQTGKINFEPNIIDIRQFIKDIIELLSNAASQKELTIKLQVDSLKVFADRNMLNTILRNLLSNAIKYSYQGKSIYVTVKEKAGMVEFSVKDEGTGINEKDIYKLFSLNENFSQQGTNNETGTGLGLILCKEFIEKHKGKIWVDTTYGSGTTFFFNIPNVEA